MTVKAILFDNDGTLVDTYQLILDSFRYATRTVLGHELPEAVVMEKVGQPLVTQIADFDSDPVVRQRLWDAYQAFNHAHHDAAVSLFPGIKDALQQLASAGYALGVVTSKRHRLCARGLDITGIAPYFSCLVGKEDCDTYKPAPGPVLAGARQLGFPPEQCIYIGDSPYDLESGNAAGAQTIAALWGMFPRSVLAACHPNAECAAASDIPGAVARIAQSA